MKNLARNTAALRFELWLKFKKTAVILEIPLPLFFETGPVVQLDRISDFGSDGWGFESLPGHNQKLNPLMFGGFFYCIAILRIPKIQCKLNCYREKAHQNFSVRLLKLTQVSLNCPTKLIDNHGKCTSIPPTQPQRLDHHPSDHLYSGGKFRYVPGMGLWKRNPSE